MFTHHSQYKQYMNRYIYYLQSNYVPRTNPLDLKRALDTGRMSVGAFVSSRTRPQAGLQWMYGNTDNSVSLYFDVDSPNFDISGFCSDLLSYYAVGEVFVLQNSLFAKYHVFVPAVLYQSVMHMKYDLFHGSAAKVVSKYDIDPNVYGRNGLFRAPFCAKFGQVGGRVMCLPEKGVYSRFKLFSASSQVLDDIDLSQFVGVEAGLLMCAFFVQIGVSYNPCRQVPGYDATPPVRSSSASINKPVSNNKFVNQVAPRAMPSVLNVSNYDYFVFYGYCRRNLCNQEGSFYYRNMLLCSLHAFYGAENAIIVADALVRDGILQSSISGQSNERWIRVECAKSSFAMCMDLLCKYPFKK